MLELISAEGEPDLSKVEIKKTFTITRPLSFPLPLEDKSKVSNSQRN